MIWIFEYSSWQAVSVKSSDWSERGQTHKLLWMEFSRWWLRYLKRQNTGGQQGKRPKNSRRTQMKHVKSSNFTKNRRESSRIRDNLGIREANDSSVAVTSATSEATQAEGATRHDMRENHFRHMPVLHPSPSGGSVDYTGLGTLWNFVLDPNSLTLSIQEGHLSTLRSELSLCLGP